jgi:hypothetical protein
MTWVNTPLKYKTKGEFEEEKEDGEEEVEEVEEEEEEEVEEEKEEEKLDENGDPIVVPKVLYFKESDYHLRVPDPKF